MSDTFYTNERSPYPRVEILDGYVQTNGAGAVYTSGADFDSTAFSFGRGIKSVVEDSTTAGLFHITLTDPYFKLVSAQFTAVSTAVLAGTMKLVGFNPQGGAVAGRTLKQIDVQFEQTGSAAHLRNGGFFFTLRLLADNVWP